MIFNEKYFNFFPQVQEDLADKENEFEILDFLKYNIKASVGVERAPPPLSATETEETDGIKPDDEDRHQVSISGSASRGS